MEEMSVSTVMGIAGFIIGGVFGGTAQRTNFCTMGAMSDIVFMGDYGRFRAWLLAIAVAMLGSQALHAAGVIDLYGSIYLSANFGWLGAVIGGLMFGFGMTMAGGCGNKTLVRLGAGNLKSLVVFLMLGIFAYATVRGLIGLARVWMEGRSMIDLGQSGLESQGMADMLAAAGGASTETMRWIVVAVFVIGFLWFCFKDADFRASPRNIAAGLIIGALIPVGWVVTGVLGADDFDPAQITSFTFVNPAGESIQYLMTFTGSTINFGIATVGGVIAGSFLMAVATRKFKFEAFVEVSDMGRHMIGGAIMGVGGVLALGCTVGQGITGMSTLALGSLIALVSIIIGALYGLRYLEEGNFGGALRALFARG